MRRSLHRRGTMLVLGALLVAGLPFVLSSTAGAVDRLPPGFIETTAFANLVSPTSIRFAPDGRVFVAEKRGYVKVYDGLADATPTRILDLSANVYNFWDRGLLSIQLDPNFATSPYLYALYAYNHVLGDPAPPPRWGTNASPADPCPTPPGATDQGCVASARLSRFLVQGSTVGPEQVLVEDWCQQYPSHSVGALAWGPDGALYASAGEAAGFNGFDYGQLGGNPCGDPPGGVGSVPSAEGGALRAQDLRTSGDPVGLDGTIIRVDRATGRALPGNPRAAAPDPNEARIVAHGFRNPFRFAIRPGTEELWIGDVGWEQAEEIDRVLDPTDNSVDNFGWPCYEAGERQYVTNPPLTLCQDLWDEGPGAIVAPWFTYRHDSPFGPDDGAGTPSCPTGSSSGAGIVFYQGGLYPDAFDGAMFFSDFSRRCIWTMRAGSNGVPDPATRSVFRAGLGFVDLVVSPQGELFGVDFNNGTIRRWTYQDPQVPTTTTNTTTTLPSSNTPPRPTIANPLPTNTWRVGKVISFSGSASDTEQGTLPAGSLQWRLRLHHCDDQGQCHAHELQTWTGVASGSFTTPDHGYPSFLEVELTATDAGGLRGTTSVQLQPKTVQLTVAANVTGVSATINGVTSPVPLTHTVIVESRSTLSVPSPQTVNGTTYTFTGWADGGPATRDVIAGWSNVTYRANFTPSGAPSPPVAAYSFDSVSGAALPDRAGNHPGTISGATWVAGGRSGGALSFDGVNDVVTIADAADLDLTQGMTIEAWVQPAAVGGSRSVIHKASGTAAAWSVWSNTNVGNGPSGRALVNGLDRRPKAPSPLPAGMWSHLALTFDGSTLRLYVNATQVASLTATGSLAVTSDVLRLGGTAALADSFKGLVDDVRVYGRALTAAQLQTDSTTPVP